MKLSDNDCTFWFLIQFSEYNPFVENGAELKKYCGKLSKKQLLNQTIRTSGNSIDVDFDGKVSQRGFKLKIKAVPENSPKAVSF